MERIYVTVRARPLSPDDAKSSPWRISGNSITFSNSSSKFDFDRIFGDDCRTKEVYEARTKEIVAAAVGGFNGTVFAYGQTNSGKTHTMRGSASEPGVIPLAVRELFEIIEEVLDREFLLRMSYMEIYNEEINDLLAPEHRRLQIHESLDRGIFVAGLREEIVVSPDQVLGLMEFGESHRHIGETNMNLHSSRSHTIFRMIIESRDKAGDEESSDSCDAVRVSVLNLVDLAGSERAAKTGAEGVRLKEGSHINKSLMTLGTVIKKLSEGAESQGGHVPYRDSKLTRILQSALGGNANTAIICNITLAQIHADETKSSLQFASRALRVTNCARVNEILTDAALLKRQKKEIEELRAKLQASPSDHLENEILHLRNTLLQTELERERIALELEEEKRAQVERERVLEEQARKIKNLSSMVLYSNRDEVRDLPKKDKRRDTWCPGKLMVESSDETPNKLDLKTPGRKLSQVRVSGPLVPFDELVTETQASDEACKSKYNQDNIISDECVLPDPSALLKVTNRRKASQKKKSSPVEINELCELELQYEDLLLKSEAQRIMYEVQIDCWKSKVLETYRNTSDCPVDCPNDISPSNDVQLADAKAMHIIEELKEQIKELQLEKSLSDKKLESAVDSIQKQNASATEQYEKLHQELQNAKEEAKRAQTEISDRSTKSMELSISNSESGFLQDLLEMLEEAQSLTIQCGSISLVNEELLKSYSHALNEFTNLKSLMYGHSKFLRTIFDDHGKVMNCLKAQVAELEKDKLQLLNMSENLMEQLQVVSRNSENSVKTLTDLSEQYEAEKSELLSHIDILQREICSLSSSSLSREKESLRKDLEKTRAKLKETESKLKNTMQEKTRLEGEKANAEREIKKLHSQKALLERDISKRESIAGRRRESCVDRPKVVDSKRAKGQENLMQQTLQEEYRKLEVLAFEMETTIGSLEEELAAANQEKEEMLARNESLSFELEMLSGKFETSNSELNVLNQELLDLRLKLENHEASHHSSESQMTLLVEEKEELATQLTNALLEMEEERAVWAAKEKASIQAIEDNANVYNNEITSLSTELTKVRNEMESLRKESEVLQQMLKGAEEQVQLKDLDRMDKSSEIDRLKLALDLAESEKRNSEELLKSKLDALSLERNLASEAEQLSAKLADLEHKVHQDEVKNNKEKTKLIMRLRSTQTKLDAVRERYKEAILEQELMHKEFKEASSKLKDQLASYGVEVLNLKKRLAAAKSN